MQIQITSLEHLNSTTKKSLYRKRNKNSKNQVRSIDNQKHFWQKHCKKNWHSLGVKWRNSTTSSFVNKLVHLSQVPRWVQKRSLIFSKTLPDLLIQNYTSLIPNQKSLSHILNDLGQARIKLAKSSNHWKMKYPLSLGKQWTFGKNSRLSCRKSYQLHPILIWVIQAKI